MSELFRKIAEAAAIAVGSYWAFLVAIVTVVIWAATGPFFGYSDTWQLFINTGTTNPDSELTKQIFAAY